MFRGATSVNLDSKGRFAIPTRYRAILLSQCQGQFICTADFTQPCLLFYPLDEWRTVEQKLSQLSSFDPIQRSIQRVMLGHATECEMDSAGRILLSPILRQFAQLEQHIMFVGQLNKFEIWQEQLWQKQIDTDVAIGRSNEAFNCEILRTFSF